MIENFIKKLDIEYYSECSLKKYNTYRLNTICKYLAFPDDERTLIELVSFLKNNEIKYLFLGNGSNVIFSNDYFDGVIIKLNKLNKFEIKETKVVVGAGCSLAKVSMDCANNSLKGLAFAVGIPGQIGASIAMNAGAYKEDMSSVVETVRVLTPDLKIKIMAKDELNFSYRDSFLKSNKDYIVLEATLNLQLGDKDEIIEKINKRRSRRIESQPLEYPSAGSVFRNPPDMFAGEMIEKCNLKGKNINGAEVSVKHANFIINKGNATGKDIILLLDLIKKEVKEKYNIDLKQEQIII